MVWGSIRAYCKRCVSAVPSASTLSTWANIAGGFSTLAAATVAIWAFFFSNIAEELTRQYNAEVAALNEQVVDLRRERRDLDLQVQTAKADKELAFNELAMLKTAYQEDQAELQASINMLKADRARLQTDVAALESLGTQLQSELSSLQDERRVREKELRKIEDALLRSRKDKDTLLVELVTRRVSGQLIFARVKLAELRADAATARDIVAYIAWRREMDAIAPIDGSKDEFTQLFEAVDKLKTMPPTWRLWWRPEFNRDPPLEFAEAGTKDGLVAFRHRLSKPDRSLTAGKYVRAALLDDALAPLPPEDHSRLIKAIDIFFAKHSSLLSQEIVVVQPKTADESQVAQSGARIFEVLTKLEILVEGMGVELGELVRIAR